MTSIHAGCVLVGEAGLLIRGPSGSGKSTLARMLVEEGSRRGQFARLVSDDRTHLSIAAGRLIARPVAPLGGLIEMRGLGLMPLVHEAAAIVRLVVDCGEAAARLPQDDERETRVENIILPRIALIVGYDAAQRIFAYLRHHAAAIPAVIAP